jgi:hypothetical protein
VTPPRDEQLQHAMQQAALLGVEVDYAERADIASLVSAALVAAAQMGVVMPAKVRVSRDFAAEYASVFVALAEPDGELVINPDDSYWSDPAGFGELEGPQGTGFISTGSAFHVVFHELGHLNHLWADFERALQLEFDHENDAQTARRVSTYAAEAPGEFVAEAFAGRLAGVEYDQEVNELYDRLGGPELSQGA